MRLLPSYLSDEWALGSGKPAELVNPATEEVLAGASSAGADLEKALAHARDVGGPALRALSFRERGELLEKMSKAIFAERDALIDLAIANGGNTRSDAKFDIDGATATLMAYAELGKKLGDRQLLVDGEPTDISGSRLQGYHVLSPRHGVAVHIGAFNFPAWGWAEKAACALLAGMPVLTKPATATALLAHRTAEICVGAGFLPRGAFSFLCGSAGDLLEHLTWKDVVAFTGGSGTGLTIRKTERLLAQGVRVNVEADSLNSALLLPEAEDATIQAFVRDVARDMTQKTGQKCTAIRRVVVPESCLERVREALSEQLATIKIGNPALDEVRMGPVATASQKRDVLAGIERLRAETKLAFGDPARLSPIGVPAGKGFFVPLLLLEAADALAASSVHEHEVFGPVATLLPYDGSVASALQIVRAGQGGLVASVYGDDRKALSEVVQGIAPWHGRLVVVDAKVADKSIAPGTVLPQLVHGGPGRAGGGEELGGLRGMALYQQRTAVQGNGPLVAKFVGAG
ncbi:MAG: 3,4-dehydroadipyl-CoA semialdehyde dehydrogenase [Myxococcales bacterium]|nr:3,4-dehydroadipyl-CoA semialdehyde dehydrogenase [Myxococcales bacterium]